MATQLSIVNGVLNELGELSVSNVNDNTHAKLIDEKVDLTYKRALTDTNWTFSTQYVELVQTTDLGIPNLPFCYQLPFDFERLVEIPLLNDYRILEDKVYTNTQQGVDIFYISNQVSFNLWPVEFEKYIIYKVAAEASLVLTNNVRLTQYLMAESNKQRDSAISDNANRQSFKERVVNKYDRRVQVL